MRPRADRQYLFRETVRKDYAGATVAFKAVTRLAPDDATAWYRLAALEALEGNHAMALDTLDRAVFHGYCKVETAKADGDFAVFHGHDRWDEILGHMGDVAAIKIQCLQRARVAVKRTQTMRALSPGKKKQQR